MLRRALLLSLDSSTLSLICTFIMLSVKRRGIKYLFFFFFFFFFFFKSLVWYDLGLNPGILGHWQTLYPLFPKFVFVMLSTGWKIHPYFVAGFKIIFLSFLVCSKCKGNLPPDEKGIQDIKKHPSILVFQAPEYSHEFCSSYLSCMYFHLLSDKRQQKNSLVT